MEQIRISGKNLGQLGLESFCPRCFWLKLHSGDKLPYQIFPGIFSSIDSYTKKVTNVHFQHLSQIPPWLTQFGELSKPVKAPTHYHFYVVDSETNIRLTGVPDEILQRTDDSYSIADYKTAKFTGNQDKLLPMYEIQLNAYAYIGNRTGFNPVTGIGLVYYEPRTELDMNDLNSRINADGFNLRFVGRLLALDLDADGKIAPLLARVRDIYDKPSAPTGVQGCEDCLKLNKLVELLDSSRDAIHD